MAAFARLAQLEGRAARDDFLAETDEMREEIALGRKKLQDKLKGLFGR